jgi:hypothetical protein
LISEEQLCHLPEHRALLSLLSSATGEPMSSDDQEQLYGPGVRGLLRFLVRYRHLRKTLPPEDRKKRLRTFLLKHYTDWGLREISGVYECLCDIIMARLKVVGGTEEDAEDLCAALIADLEVLRMPRKEAERWVGGVKRRASRTDLVQPVDEALGRLKKVSDGEEGEEDWSEEEEEDDMVVEDEVVVDDWEMVVEVQKPGSGGCTPGVLEQLGARIEAANGMRRRAMAFGAEL